MLRRINLSAAIIVLVCFFLPWEQVSCGGARGTLAGIEIDLPDRWLLIAVLVVLPLAGRFAATYPQWGSSLSWGLVILTALLFFAAIVVHELSHATIARLRGLPVKSSTLFALGGVAQIEREASDAKTEFWMGIVGPITSAIIGAVCLAGAFAFG